MTAGLKIGWEEKPSHPSKMAEAEQTVFGRMANKVDSFFSSKYYRIGGAVGTRPCTTLGVTFLCILVCLAGFSQFKSESRADKLWIPQGTIAQEDSASYGKYFPSTLRIETLLIEAKSGSVLQKDVLLAAMKLHEDIEKLTSADGMNMSSMCVMMPSDGHPCFINSVLGTWSYSSTNLQADNDPIASINNRNMSPEDLQRMFGDAQFNGNQLTSAKAMSITYFMKSNRQASGGSYSDDIGDNYEESMLKHLKCEDTKCDGGKCVCGYDSPHITVYPQLQRSFSDAFGQVVRGDVNLTIASYYIMILYLVINLGGLCHKVRSRALLSVAAILCIVVAGGAGYGISMWLQFAYTPVHSVLPFVLLGIGVDDSFVIINALDRTDPSLPVPERMAKALSHAGVSIMVTSLTDFVAFAISVSSALPALASFCMYAAFAILMLFIIQLTLFTAFATLDQRRIHSNRIDCCFCIQRGCPCCRTVPVEEANAAIERGEKDPNQMLCKMSQHKGGALGSFLENKFGPVLVKKPVAAAVVVACLAFCGICVWQTTLLAVQDTQRNFIPDDSYVAQTLNKNDRYFGTLGQQVYIMTHSGDYFAAQAELADIGNRLDALGYMQPSTGQAFDSWASAFKTAIASGAVGVPVTHSSGIATVEAQYYTGLAAWLNGAGRAFQKDIKWVDDSNPQSGIKVSRFSAEFKPMNRVLGDRLIVNADKAVEVMDGLRAEVNKWTAMPGGKPLVYTYQFLVWETFRIIKKELYMSLGLCLAAVLVITLILIAHPLTAGLVFICVVMTVVDILGCMNMWGLAIDNVSVIQLVIAVGLCVDYAAHVGHNFMTQNGELADRVVATLGNVGTAVLNGGVSTFLATMLLGLSKSYVFRVLFQSFFLTVTLGLFHGMVLLPALLSLIGPASYGGKKETDTDTDKKVVGSAKADGSMGG